GCVLGRTRGVAARPGELPPLEDVAGRSWHRRKKHKEWILPPADWQPNAPRSAACEMACCKQKGLREREDHCPDLYPGVLAWMAPPQSIPPRLLPVLLRYQFAMTR